MNDTVGCNRILIRGVNWVGDAVMTMPAIRCLRDHFGQSSISLMVKPWVLELFRHDPNIDETIEYAKEFAGLRGKFKAASRLRQGEFDCAFLLQNAFDAALTAALAGIPGRIGYARDWRSPLLTRAVQVDREILRLHHIRYYLSLLQRAGLRDVRYRLPWIYPSIPERLEAQRTLHALRRPVIALNPGAAYGSAKRWPAEKFARVATRVIADLGGSVVIFGSARESKIGSEIIAALDRDFVTDSTVRDLSGRTGLGNLCDLIAQSDALVTNDSGPLHIAYAVGTPMVALFGSTDPALTGPPESAFEGAEFSYRFRVLKSDVPCSPCFERTCRLGDLRCMEQLEPETVVACLREVLPDKRALFFDRDGTLCRDAHYLSRMEDLEVYPATGALRELKQKGFLLVGISNQSGISRGIVEESFVQRVNAIFTDQYSFDAFYYCPHHPEDRCACRKPMHGMLLRARADLGIDLRRSYLFGDSPSDMGAAALSGMTAVQVGTPVKTLEHADHAIESVGRCASIVAG